MFDSTITIDQSIARRESIHSLILKYVLISLNDNIQIKLLADCQEHIPELAVLNYQEFVRFWNSSASIERAEQDLIKHSSRDQMPLTFIAIHNEKPIGMTSLRENDGIRLDLVPWLGGLVVTPDYRGRGVGNRLIEVVKNEARFFGYDKLFLLAFDKTIQRRYMKLGWKDIGVDKLNGYPVVVMEIGL